MAKDTKDNSIIAPVGKNFSPLKPFLDLKDKLQDKQVEDHHLVKALKEKYSTLINTDKETWRDMICVGQINALFIQGEQVLKINRYSGLPTIIPRSKNDKRHDFVVNKMQYYSTNWQAKVLSSNPDIMAEAYSNNDQAIAQAKKTNIVADYLQSSFWDTRKKAQMSLNAQIWGWYGGQVKPDYTSKSISTFKDITEDVPTQIGQGWGVCPECGYKGNDSKKMDADGDSKDNEATESPDLCPNCGSDSYQYDAPIMKLLPKVTGKEKVFLPEIIWEEWQFASTRWNLPVTLEQSSWAIRERRFDKNAIERIIGNIRIPAGDSDNDFGLDAIEFLSKRGAAINGMSNAPDTNKSLDKITLTEMYLGPDDLYDIKIGGDERTVEGGKLPKGKRMSEVFPDGCLVIGTNGMSLILGIYAEHHSDSVSSGVYHMKAASGTGRGIEDAIMPQKQFNRRYSQIDNIFQTRSSPATLVIENAISPQNRRKLNEPGADIPVNISQLPDGIKSVGDVIYPIQAADVPSGLLETTFNNLESMLQVAYHITNFAGGNPRVDNKTATGARILDANGDELFAPLLATMADFTVDTVKKGFYKWTECTPLARFIPFKSKSKSGNVGEEISGKDVEAEYRWSYVPGSQQPKNRFTESDKNAQFFAMFQGGAMGWSAYKQQFPKDAAAIAKTFDIDFALDEQSPIEDGCRLRLENAKKMLPPAGQPDFLQILFNLTPSLEITEASLGEKAAWFQALLDSPEGLNAPTIERKLIAAFVEGLTKLAQGQTIEMQKMAAQAQVEGNQPLVDAQQQQEQQSAQMQAQQEAGNQQAQNEQSAQQAQIDAQNQANQANAQTQQSVIQAANDEAARNQQDSHKAADLANEEANRQYEMQIQQMQLQAAKQNQGASK